MVLAAYLELTKPRILSMVLVTTALGFYMGNRGIHDWGVFLFTLLGVGLGSGGAAVLNNYLERDVDALMVRTRGRPLPAGRVSPLSALVYGTALVMSGVAVLVLRVHLLAGFLVLLAAFLYVLVYTPMKRATWFNTSVGAVPGAIPPMAGWAAATGRLDIGAWVLFAVLYLWQHAHFYAIAWMYRDDYRKGGFKMLPPNDPAGARAFRHILVYCALLLLVSLQPVAMGLAGWLYLWGVGIIGFGLGFFGWALALSGSRPDAGRLVRASVVYLPCWLLLTVVDLAF